MKVSHHQIQYLIVSPQAFRIDSVLAFRNSSYHECAITSSCHSSPIGRPIKLQANP